VSKDYPSYTIQKATKERADDEKKRLNMSADRYLIYLMDHCTAVDSQISNKFGDLKEVILMANRDDPKFAHLIDLYLEAYEKSTKSERNLDELHSILIEFISGRGKYKPKTPEAENE